MRLLGTKLAMSTAFHPQTDGQTERMNKVIEEMIRAFVERRPREWERFLPALEFAYNNSVHTATGHTPFELDCGQHPVDPHYFLTNAVKQTQIASVEDFTTEWRLMLDRAHESLERAQAEMADRANRHRMDMQFKKGERVWLSTKHLLRPGEKERWVSGVSSARGGLDRMMWRPLWPRAKPTS